MNDKHNNKDSMSDIGRAPRIADEELELIRRTVASGATTDELQLYFYDCRRHGVHPLDRLLHFTKRGGKYTPITSIDLMRMRAHETGECAGIEQPVFQGNPGSPGFLATITVKRFCQGQSCDFQAAARWEEYYPGDAAGLMWRKMPHTMLGKCCEALALRKAFPKQLAGLYAREELDQAGEGVRSSSPVDIHAPLNALLKASVDTIPDDAVILQRIVKHETSKGRPFWLVTTHANEECVIWQEQCGALAEQIVQEGVPVTLACKGEWDNKAVIRQIARLPSAQPAAAEKTAESTPSDETVAF